jgi:hypothetical protein
MHNALTHPATVGKLFARVNEIPSGNNKWVGIWFGLRTRPGMRYRTGNNKERCSVRSERVGYRQVPAGLSAEDAGFFSEFSGSFWGESWSTVLARLECLANVLPDNPVRLQILCTVAGRETSCELIRRIRVNAYTAYIMGEEHSAKPKSSCGRATASVRGTDRNPPQFSVTAEAARQVSSD